MKQLNIKYKDFEKLFPFAFSVSGDGTIQCLGPSLKKLLPASNIGQSFDREFQFIRPRIAAFDDEVTAIQGELIVLKAIKRDFVLMGQVIHDEDENIFHFVVSLAVQDIEKLKDLKLNFNDFAIQDQVFDFLMLIQTQRRAIKEAELLNKKLEKAHAIAVQASEMKSQFLANMSHELRTPMNGVLGMASILLETTLDPSQKDYVQTIVDSGEGMLVLINDILDLSKIEAGHLQLEKSAFSLMSVVEEVFQVIEPTAAKKQLRLERKFGKNFPGLVLGDPQKVKQILLNLMGNAVKFTDGGSVSLKTETTVVDEKKISMRFTIKDTGIGMNDDTMEKIFMPFVQGDSSMSKRHGGTGLGLSICKKLVEAMNGQIHVISQIGVGSEFIFSIELEKN